MALADLPPLPANATIEPCTDVHINAFRRMNALLLPIPYRDEFYTETLTDPLISSITRVALWKDSSTAAPRLVAGIRCRLLPSPLEQPLEEFPVLYISTITTLAPFRRHALAGHLLSAVTRTAVERYRVRAVVAHVWEANEDGLEWYSKRGFKVVGRDEMYYRRLAPHTAALLVRRDIGPADLVAWRRLPPSEGPVQAV